MAYHTKSLDSKVEELLKEGAVGLMPVDTIYGLSCRAQDKEAVEKVYSLKKRQANKPLIVLVAEIEMLDELSISKEQARQVRKYWPGPLTAIFEASNGPVWLTRGSGRLAVRIPDYPDLLKLIKKTGPLVSTSANIEGAPPARTAEEALKIFGDSIAFYVNAGERAARPSTIVKVNGGNLKVIRQGELSI